MQGRTSSGPGSAGSGANGRTRAYSPRTHLWRKRTRMLSMDDLFKGRQFDREIIILCVRWYLRFKLSFRARNFLGSHHDHALDSALCSGVRKAVEPFRLPGWHILAGRRNLCEDQRQVDLIFTVLWTSKERRWIFCSAPSGMLQPPKRFSGGRSRVLVQTAEAGHIRGQLAVWREQTGC